VNKEYNRFKHKREIIRYIRKKNTEKVLKHCFLGGRRFIISGFALFAGSLEPDSWEVEG